MVKERYRVLIGQREMQESNWSKRDAELTWVKEKIIVLIGQIEMKESHWSKEKCSVFIGQTGNKVLD